MGLKCISDDCTVKIYTISDEIEYLTEKVIEFFLELSPGIYLIMILMLIIIFVIYIFYIIRKSIKGKS